MPRSTPAAFLLLLAAALPAQEPTPHPAAAAATRLVYDLPAYEVGHLLDTRPGTAIDQLVAELLVRLRQRLPDSASISPLGGTQFAIELHADAATIATIRRRIETRALEMRAVVDPGFDERGITFDLPQERQRLEAWLAAGGRALVAADPLAIARFNGDKEHGPLAFGNLRWVPHRVRPQHTNPQRWSQPYSRMAALEGVPALADVTVAAFDPADYHDGAVPPQRGLDAQLLEFVAVNLAEVAFGGDDLAANGVTVATSLDGRPGIDYRLRDDRAAAYANWSQKLLRKHMALIVDGEVVSAPWFATRIPGVGQISGGFTEAEAEDLAQRLRLGDLPIAPVLLRQEPSPAPPSIQPGK